MSSSTTGTKKKMIVLMTSDGQSFEVEESVAMESQTIKHMIEDVGSDDGTIPLPNVTSNILAMVIEYCKRHANSNKPSSSDKQEGGTTSSGSANADLKAFNTEFVKVDQTTLFDLILAANYLDIKTLLDLTCQTVADMIKDKKVEEIRKIFNIKNDFTPEEEEQIRKENAWAFE